MKTDKWYSPERLNAMYDEADSHPSYKRYLGEFKRGVKFYRGDHWWEPDDDYDDVLISDDIPVYRENMINKAVNDANSILLKNRPIVHTHPLLTVDAELSNDMDQILYAAWKVSSTQHTARTMLKTAQFGGLAIGKVVWNRSERAKHPDGEVGLVYIPPIMIRFDPTAPNDKRGRGARYIIHSTMRTPSEIAVRYGTEGLAALGVRGVRGRGTTNLRDYYEILRDYGLEEDNDNEENAEVSRRVEVREYWLFPTVDDVFELVTGTNPTAGKYKYGAVATMIRDRVVRIEKNPFAATRKIRGEDFESPLPTEVGHKMHPFVLWYWRRDSNEDGESGIYECEGQIKQMEAPQTAADALGRNIHQNATTIANPSLSIIEDAMDIDGTQITMPPSAIYRINAGFTNRIDDVMRFNTGQPMPAYVIDVYREKKNNIPLLGSVSPGMVGLAPEGTSHLPTGALVGIQEASFAPMWAHTDELEAAIEDIAVRYLGLIQQYYAPERYVDVSDVGEQRHLQIQGKHITQKFNLFVVAGTTTPLYDIEKDFRLSAIQERVDAALTMSIQSGTSIYMHSCLIYLRNLRYPYAHDWIQLLRQQIDILEGRMQDQMLDEASMAQQEVQQEASPAENQLDIGGVLEGLGGNGVSGMEILEGLEGS